MANEKNERWTVEAGRGLSFDGRPFVHLSRGDDDSAEAVEADGAVILIADLFNRENVTPDSIYEQHMGHPRGYYRRAPNPSAPTSSEPQAPGLVGKLKF